MNEFSVKTTVISGRNSILEIGGIIQGLNYKKVLICTDAFLSSTAGFKELCKSLDSKCIEYLIYTKVQPEPIDTDCDLGAKFCKENKIELIVAFGGGSIMDQSKAMAAIVTNNKSCRELEGFYIENNMLPLICVPTTAGTGSEVTFVSVVTNTEKHYKMTIMDRNSLSPAYAICDESVLETLPSSLVSSCGVDALTHAIEAYTSMLSQPLTDSLALTAIKLINENITVACNNPKDSQAQKELMTASTLAGIAFINSNVGSVHAISEVVGAKYHIPHGVANSIFLPYVVEYNIIGNEKKFSEISLALKLTSTEATKEEMCQKLVEHLRNLIEVLKIPKFSSFKNVNVEDFKEISELSLQNELSLTNPRQATQEMYYEILEKAYHK